MARPAARKTTAKTTARPSRRARAAASAAVAPEKVPQPHGGALNAGGTPGNKGGTGRPPTEHLEWCRRVVSDPDAEREVEAVLKDRNHAAFATMWKVMMERGYGKPAQPVTGEGGTGPVAHAVHVTVTRRIVRAAPARAT